LITASLRIALAKSFHAIKNPLPTMPQQQSLTDIVRTVFVFAFLFNTILAVPTISERGRRWRRPQLPKGSHTFKGKPYNTIELQPDDVLAEFGDVKALSPGGDAEGAPTLAERAIIGNDDRTLLNSTDFPYRAMGKVLWSDGSWCTGTLVGDRVVLTASHCVPSDSSITLQFQPAYFDKPRFPNANIVNTAYYIQQTEANFDFSPCGLGHDLAILQTDTVLSDDLGGYLGVLMWNASLSAIPNFYTLGYPSDKGGDRPYIQTNGISAKVDPSLQCDATCPLSTSADSQPGQSGGPLWIPSIGTKYIVGIDSVGSDSVTVYASGKWLVSLVNWGRANWK
jgi:V8-like Glu-specific endopeptidase